MLLGFGWNFGLIAGTTMIVDATAAADRARTQGGVDVSIAIAGALGGGLSSGVMVAATSYGWLALLGAAISLLIVPALALHARRV